MSVTATLYRKLFRIGFIERAQKKRLPLPVKDDNIYYRLISPNDSIEELTDLINRAYSVYKEKGLSFLGLAQNSDITRKRLKHTYTILAFKDSKLIGTISYKPPWECRGTEWFNKNWVAKFNQLAVDPLMQNYGIGGKLLDLTELIASFQGASELALDTSEQAETLISYYKKRSYRFIDYYQWKHTNYRSVILSKALNVRH